ncbi:energy transducer TonB [Sphingobacterium wenxiniae]|uniref:Outer membrane transport energization protein TonB n=1 Tax=Sphingobacterium wenxiniae TaxID=683125 RepID=A0A1I6VEX4_9SPHI|nr:energy transducer TonB [Sphingobacterium wenxiniae]SFT12252.1 outer membrane transport energization protein TonB [Sphingobacterium wenxiniae]
MWNKLDIYEKEWLNVIFATRNQAYGAYELRRLSTQATNKALLLVMLAVVLLVGAKLTYDKMPTVEKNTTTVSLSDPITIDELVEKVPEKEEEPLPAEQAPVQKIAQDLPSIDLIRHVEPKVVDAHRVAEDVASQDDLKDKMSARLTLRKVGGGSSVVKGEFGPAKQDGAITGRLNDVEGQGATVGELFTAVEVMPKPKDGMAEFVKWVAKNYNYPASALEQGVKGTVQVSFVVEPDGSLSSFKVLRDIGFGTGEEAIRLLKKAPSWHAGIQNGRPVRVSYTLPLALNTINQ